MEGRTNAGRQNGHRLRGTSLKGEGMVVREETQRHTPLVKKRRNKKKFFSQCRIMSSAAEAAARPTGPRFHEL